MIPLSDTVAPSEFLPRIRQTRRLEDSTWQAADWQPAELGGLVGHLASAGTAACESIAREDLLAGWHSTVISFLEGLRAEESSFRMALARTSRLSPEGLAAGLDAVLRGLLRPHADRLAAAIEAGRSGQSSKPPTVILLASNLPALGTQPLLRALLERRPVLIKSAGEEPLFMPRFVAELIRNLPALANVVAVTTWQGGDRRLEDVAFASAGEVVVYGGEAAISDLASRLGGRLRAHGPRASLAIVGPDCDLDAVARGLAEDVALFDQRGCLSVQAVYVIEEPQRGASARATRFAAGLARALSDIAIRWPQGPARAAELAGVQQLRAEAELRELASAPLQSLAGTVVLEPRALFLPSPGRRTVRVHSLGDEAEIVPLLRPWRGRLQGVAIDGRIGEETRRGLGELGVTRIAPAGSLQRPDATWENWGERL